MNIRQLIETNAPRSVFLIRLVVAPACRRWMRGSRRIGANLIDELAQKLAEFFFEANLTGFQDLSRIFRINPVNPF